MKYENINCPVCGEPFTLDSDVVVCPDCGTPHHRDCYEKVGHCWNSSKHGEDFCFKNPNTEVLDTEQTKPSNDKEVPKIMTGFNQGNPKETPNGSVPGLEIDREGNAIPVYRPVGANEKIGDFTVEDYGKVVQINNHKYMPKFLVLERTGKKASWNWAAFFFGPYWLFFRKMYKYGIIALLINCIIPLIFIGDIVKYSEEYSEGYQKFSEVMLSEAGTQAEIQSKADAVLEDMPKEPAAMVAASYVQLALSVILGVFGNYFYKEHCKKLLAENADKKKDNHEAYDEILKKKGGRSYLLFFLGVAMMVVLTFVVSYIYVSTGTDLASLIRRVI